MKSNLDLHVAAGAAALSSLDLTNSHAVHLFEAEQFAQQKQDPRDFDFWHGIFVSQRQYMLGLRRQKPQSVIQDEAEAAKAAAAKNRPIPQPAPAPNAS